MLLAHDVWHHMRGDWTTNQVDTADHCSQRIERPQAINICPSKQLSRSRRSSVKQEDNIGTECEGLRETLCFFDHINGPATAVVVEMTVYYHLV